MTLSAQEKAALEAAVKQLKDDPSLAHDPDFASLKELLTSWGGKVPPVPDAKAAPKGPTPMKEPEKQPEKEEEEEEEPEEPEEPEEEDPERLPEDSPPYPARGPGGDAELSDEQMDKQADCKQAAQDALEDGNLTKAIDKFTEAISIGGATAMMFAKRADMLLKAKRPCAAIADCDAAIEINPDSAKAFRTRGKAARKLGRWEDAHRDLATAQQLDFDDETEDVAKFVEKRWKKIQERKTRLRLKEEAKKLKERQRAKEEAKRIYEQQKEDEKRGGGGFPGGMPGGFPGGMPGGFPGMPGGMGGMPGGMPAGMPAGMDPSMFAGLMSDPELQKVFSNPRMMGVMQDIMSNPGNAAKYQNDPEVMELINKLGAKMGGMGMGSMFGMGGGMPGGGMPGGGMPGAGGGSSAGASAGPSFEEVDEID